MENVDWTSVAALCAFGVVGFVVGALSMGAHAWDQGFRAGLSHAFFFREGEQ